MKLVASMGHPYAHWAYLAWSQRTPHCSLCTIAESLLQEIAYYQSWVRCDTAVWQPVSLWHTDRAQVKAAVCALALCAKWLDPLNPLSCMASVMQSPWVAHVKAASRRMGGLVPSLLAGPLTHTSQPPLLLVGSAPDLHCRTPLSGPSGL